MHTNLGMMVFRRIATKVKTVDPQEIKNFADMAHEWWNETGNLGPLHDLNRCRIPWIQNRLAESGIIQPYANPSAPLTGLSILDVGCGGGILSEGLSRLGCKVTGLDAGEDLIRIAKLHAKTQNLPNLRYVTSSIQDHAMENKEKYDVVVSSEVIEHVTEKEDFVKYCVQCVKPGGSVFVTTPNKTWLSWFHMVFLWEDVFMILPKGTHRYDMFIHVDALKEIFKKENCKIVHTCGVFYGFFRKEWYMVKNDSVTYLLHAAKQT